MSSGSLGGLSQQSSSNIQSSSQSGGAQSGQQAGEAFAAAYQQSLKQSEEDTKVASKDDVEKESLEKEQKVLNETGEGRVNEDDDVPLSTQLQNIQQHLLTIYNSGQEELAESLKDMAQEELNKLKEDGLKIDDLELPKDQKG